jgi:AcrR family transcriptional regulator
MGPPKRIRLDPEQRRKQLVELGMTMLAERGIEQISVEEIAKNAGISQGLLYNYFPSKREFHLAIVRHVSDDILQRLVPNPKLGPIDMLRQWLGNYVDYVLENRDGYVSILRGPASGDAELRTIADENRTAVIELILTHVLASADEITPSTILATRGWIAFVEETTLGALRNPQISRTQLIDMQVRSLSMVTSNLEAAEGLRV